MARRRLTPLPAEPDVPRAEHSPEPRPVSGFGPLAGAPIARVAAEAAGVAALDEMAETLRLAREEGRLALDLSLDAIAPDYLTRDRLPAEDEDMAALRDSLRAHGQRVPIEVTPLAGALPYGLISGWRRLTALRALHAATGEARFSVVRALVRRPETAAAAYVNMVEENELRVGLSQYERARVAALAAGRGIFPSENAALHALFAGASRAKLSRIRAFLELYHALDGALRFPGAIPERLGLRLVERLREGRGPQLAAALVAAASPTAADECALLERLTALERIGKTVPGEEIEDLRPGVRFALRRRGAALTLRVTGEGVTPALAAKIRALLTQG